MGQLPVTTAVAERPGFPRTDRQAAGGLPFLRTPNMHNVLSGQEVEVMLAESNLEYEHASQM